MAENMGDDDSIYNLLDGLGEADFKRFKPYLKNQTLPVPGFRPIPWGRLEKADVTDIVQLMKERYGVEGRMAITQHILKAMGRWDPTQQLQQDLSTDTTNQTVSGAVMTQNIHTLGLGGSKADQVKDIRPGLIRRTSEGLLKDLLDALQAHKPPVVSASEARVVLQKSTVLQDQMTCLIDIVSNKGETACGILLDLLKKNDPFLSGDLGLK